MTPLTLVALDITGRETFFPSSSSSRFRTSTSLRPSLLILRIYYSHRQLNLCLMKKGFATHSAPPCNFLGRPSSFISQRGLLVHPVFWNSLMTLETVLGCTPTISAISARSLGRRGTLARPRPKTMIRSFCLLDTALRPMFNSL